MAIKARAEITLSSIRDIQSVTRYYLLQSSTSAVPSKPTTNPPGGNWVTAEPTYTTGSTNSLYFTDCTVFSDNTFVYSDVSLSSSYEAAKVAYNKAAGAEDVANSANEKIDNLQIGGRNLLLNSEHFVPNSGIFSGSTATVYNESALDGELPYCASGSKYVKVTFPNLTIGEQYAFSCEVARLSGAAAQPVYITINGEEAVKVGTATAAVWTKFNVMFTATSSTTYAKVQVYTAASNGYATYVGHFRHFKLERGNKATDWTPAPEDISDRLDKSNANIKELMADGANLIIGTVYPDASSDETLPRIFGQTHATRHGDHVPSVAEHGLRVTNIGTGYTYISFGNSVGSGLPLGMNGLVAGETYTFSADVTCKQLSKNTNTSTYYLRVYYFDDHANPGTLAQNTYKNVISITKNDRGVEKSARCEFTFTIPANVTVCYLSIYCSRTTAAEFQAGDFIELRNLKLEKGSVATPWCAPIDWNGAVTAAQETADGKNTVYYQAEAPSGGAYKTNDIWFDTDNGNKMYMWNGSTWVAEQFGNAAISDLSITNAKIANGTIESAKISNLDAGKVTSGTMSAARIKGGELSLGGENDVDGVMKVYDADGNLVGSFTKEGLMAIAGTIAGWTINPGEFYTEWNQSTSNYKARLSTRDGLKFEKTNSETGFEQFLRQVIFGADNTVFLYRDRDGFQTAGFIRGIEGTAPGSSVDGGISISPNLLVTDGDGAIYADQLRISTIVNGSYIRQPQLILSGKTTISGGTSQKRATICSIPTEYQSGWLIVPFVTRTYGNSGVAPADNGDFYYAYYNSVDHEVDIKLANLLPSGVVFTFDYLIYAVPES